MNDILIVVDMQNDFVTGSLGSPAAQAIVDRVVMRINHHNGPILYTQDTHSEGYLTTQEGHHLPVPHCQKDSTGWQLEPKVEAALKSAGAIGIEKGTFGAKDIIPILKKMQADKPITSITLMGLCTDICVISNALLIKAWLPEVPLYVDAAACAGATPEGHQTALDAMKACQVVVTNG